MKNCRRLVMFRASIKRLYIYILSLPVSMIVVHACLIFNFFSSDLERCLWGMVGIVYDVN